MDEAEVTRRGIARIKQLAAERIPPYELPPDSLLREAVEAIQSDTRVGIAVWLRGARETGHISDYPPRIAERLEQRLWQAEDW